MKLIATLLLSVALVSGIAFAEGTIDGSGDPVFDGIPLAYYKHEPLLREPTFVTKAPETIVTNVGVESGYGQHWELRMQLMDPVYDPAFSGSLTG